MALNLQSIKTFLTLKLSQYSKSGGMFPSSEPVMASSDFSLLGNTLCLCLPVWPSQAVPECCPKSLAIDFWTQTWTLPPDQWVVYVLSTPKSQNKLCWVWILFKSVENTKIDYSSQLTPTRLMHTTSMILWFQDTKWAPVPGCLADHPELLLYLVLAENTAGPWFKLSVFCEQGVNSTELCCLEPSPAAKENCKVLQVYQLFHPLPQPAVWLNICHFPSLSSKIYCYGTWSNAKNHNVIFLPSQRSP